MTVSTPNKIHPAEIGASVFAPVPPEDFFRAVLDVRRFPAWAPGDRRVRILSHEGEAGMLSEWEVSFFGLSASVMSVLEEARAPSCLRWSYEGPVRGWGACAIESAGGGTVAVFRTEILPADPLLARLARTDAARSAARGHLRRSLLKLGVLVSGSGARVSVGPVVEGRRSGISP